MHSQPERLSSLFPSFLECGLKNAINGRHELLLYVCTYYVYRCSLCLLCIYIYSKQVKQEPECVQVLEEVGPVLLE